MKNKRLHLFAAALCLMGATLVSQNAGAQTDVTENYLLNPGFDSEFNYDASATGNVAQEILEVKGWTKDISIDYTITGVYQLGTAKTFNGASIPATGADGSTEGGVLALSTGWDQSLKFYQEMPLPAGKYGIATAFYNGCSSTAGSSLVGWIPASGTASMSTLSTFPAYQWVCDTVFFNITETSAEGKIQIGLLAGAGSSANSAKVSLDYVKLLYYGLDKSMLTEMLTEANTLYGDGTGVESAALKSAIDAAQAVVDNVQATSTEIVTAMENIEDAMWNYQLSNASTESPLDFTSHLTNPSFEDGTNGWVQSGMQTQTNSDFSAKAGTTYLEKWASSAPVGNCYVTQTVTGLDNGEYLLKAGAQNILQSNLSGTQTGAYIFADDNKTAVNKTGQYQVTATVINGSLTIGFKVESSTGNWVAVDNFRLYYVGNGDEAMRTALQSLITEAETLAGQKMHSEVLTTLNAAITVAKAEAEKETTEGYTAVVTALQQAITDAQASANAYASLQAAITDATTVLGDGTQEGAAALQQAITEAQAVADTDSSIETIEAAIAALDSAAFSLRIANSTGTVPTVKTHAFVARGATMAFGRMTVSGVSSSNILEQGFCWSTEGEPTVFDNRSTDYYTNNGKIYCMKELTPATIYYVRAYVLTKEYAVGYGDVVKIITIPKGKMTWSYNEGAPEADANTRIREAVSDAVDNYLNQLTSISGFHTTVNYGAGTPTADCSYGGWMRVGPNASYQRTGTILHELGHGIGVGTHEIWNGSSSPLRANGGSGTWLGDRVTEVVRFLENNTTSVLSGDGTHMWPYGVNGAHEDTGSPILYIGNALIAQALGEDGLPPTGGFCTPAYVFDQQDDVKYYIKNEDTERGLYSAYLMENEKGNLVWTDMSAEEATANDSCAWYVTFNPANCYYQLRNASTGHYITYASTGTNGIKAAAKTTPSTNENFHLMRSRVDAVIGTGEESVTTRGYWIIHPQHTLNPYCFSATSNGVTGTATFDLGDGATKQRWIFLQAEELQALESAARYAYMGQLDEMIARLKALVETPHTENAEGVDDAINAVITAMENASEASNTEIANLLKEAETATITFLAGATPSDIENPFDISFFIKNADFENNEAWSKIPTITYSCGEFFETSFDMYQILSSMPAGTYQLRAQGFQRPGAATDAYNAYVAGTNSVAAYLYLSGKTQKLQHIAADAQTSRLGGAETTVASGIYVPNNMQAASYYFAKDLYENAVTANLSAKGNLKLGIRCANASTSYWTIFDNIRLYYYGTLTYDEVTDIETMTLPAAAQPLFSVPTDIYSIVGVRVRPKATSLEGLPAGIYIVGGQKVIVK